VGGGVQLGQLGTEATNRPTVPTPDDYDAGGIGGMVTGRGNHSIRRKTAPVSLCPQQTPHALHGREPKPPLCVLIIRLLEINQILHILK
jgi:hypothetical protein